MHRKISEKSEHWQSSADRKAAGGWPRNVGYVNKRFQACYGTLSHHIGPDIQLSGRQISKAREFRVQVKQCDDRYRRFRIELKLPRAPVEVEISAAISQVPHVLKASS